MPDDSLAPMLRALALAERAVGLSDPNPRVGCVIVGAEGGTLGEGHTQEAGGPHAEVMALRDASARGKDVRGATAFITLEPCSHHGRTPPCADALVAAGIARAVVAVEDPNPQVAGNGVARLRAAGIAVEWGDEAAAEAARDLNIGFFSRMARGRPWVRMKIAASLDGRTALPDGTSQWITGEAARRDGHAWRKRAGAVLTGVGTVLDDDPRLDVRLVETQRQPLRAIVDSRLQTLSGARILQPPGQVVVYGAAPDDGAAERLRATGAELVRLPGPTGKVDLAALLGDLAAREVNELHVEAGHKLNGSLLREGLVDELLVYLAPKLLGAGREMATFEVPTLDAALPLVIRHISMLDGDLRIVARVRRDAQALGDHSINWRQ
jgi:diaminohydroxyphosphoribosylaminopyrimidine deaminase/5-amino-6-(5-phosphoribosylamino)uracil reductase